MIKAASLDLNVDLSVYSQVLRQQGLRHRIIEESGRQSIYVETDQDALLIEKSLHAFLEAQQNNPGRNVATGTGSFQFGRIVNGLFVAFLRSPATMVLIIVSLVVAIVTSLGSEAYRLSYFFYPLISATNLWALLSDIDSIAIAARTLSPMFLHFGELHLVFNLLWLWYFGRQLEALQPVWVFLLLVIFTSFVSNTTQYLAIEYNNFGGMSGVVYGLVGYTWVIHSCMPKSHLMINTNMFVFFVVALVLMEILASSWIATAAHVGGLVSGLVFGLLTVLYYRFVLNTDVVGTA